MEQQLAAGFSERQLAKFVADDEVHPGQYGDATLPFVAGFDLQVDGVDHVVEAGPGRRIGCSFWRW